MVGKRDVRYWIANMNRQFSKRALCASSYRLRDINLFNFWNWKLISMKTGLTPFDSEHQPALYESYKDHFCTSSYCQRDVNMLNIWPRKFRSWSPGRKWGLRHSIVKINLHKSHAEHFCTSSYRLRNINILNCWRWQFRSRWRSRKKWTYAIG